MLDPTDPWIGDLHRISRSPQRKPPARGSLSVWRRARGGPRCGCPRLSRAKTPKAHGWGMRRCGWEAAPCAKSAIVHGFARGLTRRSAGNPCTIGDLVQDRFRHPHLQDADLCTFGDLVHERARHPHLRGCNRVAPQRLVPKVEQPSTRTCGVQLQTNHLRVPSREVAGHFRSVCSVSRPHQAKKSQHHPLRAIHIFRARPYTSPRLSAWIRKGIHG